MRSLVPYERYTRLFDRALELELVAEYERQDSDNWEYQGVNDQNYIVHYLEKAVLTKETRLEEKRKEQAEIEARRKKRYDKTFIIDFDRVESEINAVWVPPGYRLIQLYHGGCDTYAVDHDGKEIASDTQEGEDYCDAAMELTEDAAEEPDLRHWREAYPDVVLNPETDIVLSCCTSWDKRTEELYLPRGVNVIWTDKSLIEKGEEKIDAAKFLYSADK